MKPILLLAVLFACLSSRAQTRVEVTNNKTTHIIFPAAIASVDRGSTSILVQKAGGAEHILKLKADAPGFEETNLSVITTDGVLYSFIVNYAKQPKELTLTIQKTNSRADYSALFLTAAGAKENFNLSSAAGAIKWTLCGGYVKDETLVFKFRASNSSNLNYQIEQLRFYLRDKKRSKRTASQETEILPLSIAGDSARIVSGSTSVLLVALPKFSPGKDQRFACQLLEKNGSRHLLLTLNNRQFANIQPID